MTPLDAAKELVTVLEQQQALATRQGELLAVLGASDHIDIAVLEKPKAKRGRPPIDRVLETTYAIAGEAEAKAKAVDPPKVRTSAEILADHKMGSRTPEEQARIEAEAMDIYDANVDPASDAQKRMIFGILGKAGVKGDDEMKATIINIIDKQHGVRIESISKELSKAWAGDVIDFLQSASEAELQKLIIPF